MPSRTDLILPPGFDERLKSKKAVLYCDESGNTGANYLDQQQPFYVLAGWVVPDDNNESVWVAVENLRRQLCPQSSELKSQLLKKGERQKNAIADFFEEMGRNRSFPIYLVAEKRYCVAGKIVETFLDPFYNPLLRDGFTGDVESKQELANQLYEIMPDEVLTQFAESYRNPTGDGFRDALLAVATAAREHLSQELATVFMGSDEQINEIAKAEASHSPFGKVAASLNMPCLVSFLMMAENLGRIGLHQPIRIVHDQQHTYEEGYKKIFELHQGMPRLFARLPSEETAYDQLATVAEFETADSKERLPIQAADLLAGTVNHLIKLAFNEGEPTEADLRLAKLTLPSLLIPDIKLTWLIWSEECMGRVATSLLMRVLRIPEKSEQEIQKAQAVVKAESAPLFPQTGSEPTEPLFRIPSPMYGLVGEDSGGIMILMPSAEDVLETKGEAIPVVPIFSSNELAVDFLNCFDQSQLTEIHSVDEFDGPSIRTLLDHLEVAAEVSEVLVFDPLTDGHQHMYMPAFIAGLDAILRRINRLVGSGLDKVVLQRTTINGRDATSMLLSDGRYGAMWSPVGEVVAGTTREEALERLKDAQVLPPCDRT